MTSGPTAKMPIRELAIRLLAVGGLGVSTLLLVQYLSPVHALCSHGGCATVRQSSYAAFAGIPTPIAGILFFAGLLALSLLHSSWARRGRLALAVLGGIGGVGFIMVQATVIKAYCEYCLVVDAIAVVIAGLAVTLAWAPATISGAKQRILFAGLAAVSIAAGAMVPAIYGTRGIPYRVDVRDEIRSLQVPGKVTIVEFVDFGCPACRAQHDVLTDVIADVLTETGEEVAVVYKHLPLPFHPGAKDAARAYLCVTDARAAHTLADVFFRSPKLGPMSAKAAALAVGAEAGAYDACIVSEATNATLKRDHDDATALKLQGLPTFWIGDERFEGTQPAAVIRDSINRARGR